MNKNKLYKILVYLTAVISLLFYIYFTVKWAWCSDDAYHAYSMSKNLISGNGFTPTPGKRVNVSTCPLWTLIVTLGMILFKDEYYVGMFLNLAFSWGAYAGFLYIIFSHKLFLNDIDEKDNKKQVCEIIQTVLLITITLLICMSKSFISYTTSGLENSLLFFLSTIFIIFYFYEYRSNKTFNNKSIFILAFIEGLIVFTRMDNALIFLPLCMFAGFCIKVDSLVLKKRIVSYLKRLGLAILAVVPFIIWELFSLFYYGIFVPNTALAKLNTGFPKYQYWERGFAYYIKTANWDIVVIAIPLLFILVCCLTLFLKKSWTFKMPYILLGTGILLYMAYIIHIGGDFMMGRHFTVIFWVSVLSFACLLREIIWYINEEKIKKVISGLTGIILAIILSIDSGIVKNPFSEISNSIVWGYTDERAVYISHTGLLRVLKNGKYLIRQCPHRGIQWYFGVKWYEERLYDPLLSRLPANEDNDLWMTGHMERTFPKGYQKTLDSEVNYIVNASLHAYYDIIYDIISTDLFSSNRIKKIILLNLGKYDYLIEEYLEEKQ